MAMANRVRSAVNISIRANGALSEHDTDGMRLEIAALAEVLPVGTHVYVTAASVAGQPARECRNFRASRVSRDVKQGLASTTIVSTRY